MKLKETLSELKENYEFKNFKKENPKSFFIAAFINLDIEKNSSQVTLDFFLPEKSKIAAFEIPCYKPILHQDEIKEAKEQSTNLKIDSDNLKEIAIKICETKFKGFNPSRIIAVLNNDLWNLTIMNNALGILQIKLNAITGEEIIAKKGSLIEFMGKNSPQV